MGRRISGPLDGPLSPLGAGFEACLIDQGYSADSVGRHLRLMVHASRWLAVRHLEAEDLTEERARQFLRARRAEGHTHPVSMAGMAPLLEFLRSVGAAPWPQRDLVAPIDGLLADYRRYLLEERGLSANSSIPHYLDVARRFMAYTAGSALEALGDLSAAAVIGFVLSANRGRSIGNAKSVGTRLRSLLRYLEFEGLTPAGLVAAVPSIAGWQQTGLPSAVSAGDVRRLFDSCDRRLPAGRRDFAILMVLARLGLRAGEVAALRLDGIEWRCGEVNIRGKAGREDRLPLTHEVGEAIVAWLRDGRPSCTSPLVFTRILAPHRGLSARGVSGVVRQACVRAGLPPMGSHRLRHTVATETLRAGGSLIEVGMLLRQRSLAATNIYAKVDRGALSLVARAWPGGGA
jgi:site-specific recombinase XerD